MTLDVALSQDVQLVFNVPLLVKNMPDAEQTNAGLRRLILAREQREPGTRRSNSGGWHSDDSLMRWPEPEIATLRGWIDAAVRHISALPMREKAETLQLAYRASGWANVNRHGDYNLPHSHANNHWAVVYYVAVGEEEAGHAHNGRLELRDPRAAASYGRLPGFMFGRAITITPKPGLMVVFPAWLEHWVHPFYGTGERISIAVNIEVTKYEVARAGATPAG
jgi:uncharacterized protein (TIGR02466 family)